MSEKEALEYQLKQTKEVLVSKPDSEHFLKVKKVIEAQLAKKAETPDDVPPETEPPKEPDAPKEPEPEAEKKE